MAVSLIVVITYKNQSLEIGVLTKGNQQRIEDTKLGTAALFGGLYSRFHGCGVLVIELKMGKK